MDSYLNQFKKKKRNIKVIDKNNNLKNLLSKFLIDIIFFLSSIIFTNISDNNLLLYKEYVLTERYLYERDAR